MNAPVSNSSVSQSSEFFELYEGFEDGILNGDPFTFRGDVQETDGHLLITQSQTDVAADARITFDEPLNAATISYDAYMHKGGSNFLGGAFLSVTDAEGEEFPVRIYMMRSTYGPDYGNDFANFDLPKITAFSPLNGRSDLYSTGANTSSFFDQWTRIEIAFDAENGRVTVDTESDGEIDIEYVDESLIGASLNSVRLSSYGWFTGHYTQIDNLEIIGTTFETEAPPPSPSVERLQDLEKNFIDGFYLPFDGSKSGDTSAPWDEWEVAASFNYPADYLNLTRANGSQVGTSAHEIHLGLDFNWDLGESDAEKPVVAIYDVVDFKAYDPDDGTALTDGSGGALVLHHSLPDGTNFTSVYLHVDPDIAEGSSISGGDNIGIVQKGEDHPGWGSAHLHFQILEGHVDFDKALRGILPDDDSHYREVLGDSGLIGIERLYSPELDENATTNPELIWIDPVEFLAKYSEDFQSFISDEAPESPDAGIVPDTLTVGDEIFGTLKPKLLRGPVDGSYPELRVDDKDIYEISLEEGQWLDLTIIGTSVENLSALPHAALTIRSASDFETPLAFRGVSSGALEGAGTIAVTEDGEISVSFVAPSSGTYFVRVGPNTDFNGPGDGHGGYKLRITESDASATVIDGTMTVGLGTLTDTYNVDAIGEENVNLFGNNIDNQITAINTGGTFNLYDGDDYFLSSQTSGSTIDRVIDGGDGYDVVEYLEEFASGFAEQLSGFIKVGFNSDILSNVEEIRFANGTLLTDSFTFQIEGTDDSDNLTGTAGDDEIRSYAGRYDKMFGDIGADQFIFGAEANNGTRERNVILDYQVGLDEIVLEDGASVASIRQTSSQVIVFLDGDRDAIYIRGEDVTADNISIVTENVFEAF